MKDLRTFLQELEEKHPDSLVRVKRQVRPVLEVPVIQQKLAAEGRYPVIRFDDIEGSELPLVTNLYGSHDLLAWALGVSDTGDTMQEYMRLEAAPIPATTVSPQDAPVKERIATGDDADLGMLPIVHHAVEDSGKYVVIGCMVCKDPDTGTFNVGIYRHELKGPRRLGAMFSPYHDAGHIYRRCAELGQPMEVAIFLGHHPAVGIGASALGSVHSHDEFETMGGLLGESLELTSAETVDLLVPARAEIVIEGRIHPGDTEMDGPFAEFTGYYGGPKKVGVIEVSAITWRSDAIYHDLDPAHREHNLAGVLSMESAVYKRVQDIVPSVVDVYLPPSGSCFFSAYISIDKQVEGQGRLAALAALATHANLKHIFVVDADVDVRDEAEVMWALNTRFAADEDLTVIPRTQGGNLDPVAYGEDRVDDGRLSTKVIFDATKKMGKDFPQRIVAPRDVWARIDLDDYLVVT